LEREKDHVEPLREGEPAGERGAGGKKSEEKADRRSQGWVWPAISRWSRDESDRAERQKRGKEGPPTADSLSMTGRNIAGNNRKELLHRKLEKRWGWGEGENKHVGKVTKEKGRWRSFN